MRPGGQVHDAPAVRDQRQQRLREEEHALEVDVDQLVELRLGRLSERGHVAVAGVVNEVIEGVALPGLAQHLPQAVSERRKASNVADIELDGDHLAAQRFDLGDDGCE